MHARSSAKWAAGILLGAASLLTAVSSSAEEIRISGNGCGSGVHLVAHDAHLSEILARLSRALDFQLSFESDSDPVVSIDAIRQPADLVARLASLENVSMTQAQSPRCPDRQRIVRLWVLRRGAANPGALCHRDGARPRDRRADAACEGWRRHDPPGARGADAAG